MYTGERDLLTGSLFQEFRNMRGIVSVMTELDDALNKDKMESGEKILSNLKLNMKGQIPWRKTWLHHGIMYGDMCPVLSPKAPMHIQSGNYKMRKRECPNILGTRYRVK